MNRFTRTQPSWIVVIVLSIALGAAIATNWNHRAVYNASQNALAQSTQAVTRHRSHGIGAIRSVGERRTDGEARP